MNRIDHRRHPRTPLGEFVHLAWHDSRGNMHRAKGKVIDRSKSGLMIEVSDSIEPRTFVQVQTERREIVGMACVRHRSLKGLRYLVGLELALDVRWKDKPAPATNDR